MREAAGVDAGGPRSYAPRGPLGSLRGRDGDLVAGHAAGGGAADRLSDDQGREVFALAPAHLGVVGVRVVGRGRQDAAVREHGRRATCAGTSREGPSQQLLLWRERSRCSESARRGFFLSTTRRHRGGCGSSGPRWTLLRQRGLQTRCGAGGRRSFSAIERARGVGAQRARILVQLMAIEAPRGQHRVLHAAHSQADPGRHPRTRSEQAAVLGEHWGRVSDSVRRT